MSIDSDPVIPRPRNLQIEFYRLQLMMLLNQLRQEILLYKAQRRSFVTALFLSDVEIRREHEFVANAIQDRKRWILESAKNLLYDPDDPKQSEYKEFEELADQLLKVRVLRKKWFGFKWKEMQ